MCRAVYLSISVSLINPVDLSWKIRFFFSFALRATQNILCGRISSTVQQVCLSSSVNILYNFKLTACNDRVEECLPFHPSEPHIVLLSHSGEVKTVGRVGAFVPCVHLSGSYTLLVSIHLFCETGKGNIRLLGAKQSSFVGANASVLTLTMSELNGFALAFLIELLVRDQTLVLCLNAALTWRKNQKPWSPRIKSNRRRRKKKIKLSNVVKERHCCFLLIKSSVIKICQNFSLLLQISYAFAFSVTAECFRSSNKFYYFTNEWTNVHMCQKSKIKLPLNLIAGCVNNIPESFFNKCMPFLFLHFHI